MALEFFVLEMAFVNVVSGLQLERRAVNCRLEELVGIKVRNFVALLVLDDAFNFLEPKRDDFGVLVAQLAKETRGFSHEVAAEKLIAGEGVLEVFSNLGHAPAGIKLWKRVVGEHARLLSPTMDVLDQVLKRLTDDSAIKALAGEVFVLGKDKLDGGLGHEWGCSHLQETGSLSLQDALLVFVKLEHLVDENLVPLVALKLVHVNALRHRLDQLATLDGLLRYFLLLPFDAFHKQSSLTLTFLRIYKFVHYLSGSDWVVDFLLYNFTDRELPLLVGHLS